MQQQQQHQQQRIYPDPSATEYCPPPPTCCESQWARNVPCRRLASHCASRSFANQGWPDTSEVAIAPFGRLLPPLPLSYFPMSMSDHARRSNPGYRWPKEGASALVQMLGLVQNGEKSLFCRDLWSYGVKLRYEWTTYGEDLWGHASHS